ncbi:sugar ABC transporter permease [Leptolinea sp. HRD-7]|nr:sugar ABC transporter permease [Leptolinea sp. HRD-7]
MKISMVNKNYFNRKKLGLFLLDHTIEIILIVLIAALALSVKNFMTWGNWMNILRANSLKGVMAFGMTMVIIAGLIDLSIGSTVALAGVIVARCCRDLPIATGMDVNTACIIGIAISLAIAVLVGWIHGTSTHKAGMPPFIVTLVTLNLLYGLAGIISQGFPIANQAPEWFNYLGGARIPIPDWLINALGGGNIDGIPVPAIVLIISFGLVYYVMGYTTIGRSVYATGGNAESARLSGIDVGKTKIICFVTIQILAVVAGFMTSGQLLAGSFSFGRGWELDVISAVIIGGTSFNGGIGKVWGTLWGVIFIGVISNGMTLLNFDIYTQYVVRGIVMFLAVFISSYRVNLKA